MCALVLGPIHSDRASGNMGSICYSSWRGRAIARGVWTGTDPGTSAQLAERAIVTELSQAWGSVLTDSDRSAWEEFARSRTFPDRFGIQRVPTGYLLFMRLNRNRRSYYSTYLTKPVAIEMNFFAKTLLVAYYPATLRVAARLTDFLPGRNNNFFDFWKAGPYDSPARKPIAGEWRRIVTQVASNYYDYSTTASKYYWYRIRPGWLNGEFFPFVSDQVYTG